MTNRQGRVLGVVALMLLLTPHIDHQPETRSVAPAVSIGSTESLLAAYEHWKDLQPAPGELLLPLTFSRGRSARFSTARGKASIDLHNGILDVEVEELAEDLYDVWFVDRSPALSETAYRNVGGLKRSGTAMTLRTELDRSEWSGFALDAIAIAPRGTAPEANSLVVGAPNLFQRMYYAELQGQPDKTAALPFAFLLPAPAYAQDRAQLAGMTADLNALVAEGEDLFFNETFGGNGRTCGTCHPSQHNFTIDPDFIATLPADDPLFVAENDPALADLENPTLMRGFGLILANLDGFEDPAEKFVMRSVPHMLALSTSLASHRTEPPFEQTGWSGDGAPGNGTLREFSIGAVKQHFPRTLNRVDGEDFRLPTESELDAMEAFMLSLGRQQELDLNELRLADGDAEEGRRLFMAEDSLNKTVKAAKCNICHQNAGALSALDPGVNENFNTGVEDLLHPADLTGELRPRDGGFGTTPDGAGGFGNGAFNTTTLVEAADTPPYFHNNVAGTLEEAIGFYDSSEFKHSPLGLLLKSMDSAEQELDVEVDALAAFLRVINAVENIRSARAFHSRAAQAETADAQKLLVVASADLGDAIEVLNQGELHEDALGHLQDAQDLTNDAIEESDAVLRGALIVQAQVEEDAARALMVVAESSPTPTAVPVIETPVPATNTAIPATATDTPVAPTPTATPQQDLVRPDVTMLFPLNNSVVSGIITIAATATDDVGIAKVVFKIGTTKLGQDFTAPFTMDWDTTAFADERVKVKAIAIDRSGKRRPRRVLVTIDNGAANPPATPTGCVGWQCNGGTPPPTPTPAPPTSTPISPADTPTTLATSTAAVAVPTDPPVLPTDTPTESPPTDTPVPPTDTPIRTTATATAIPPTNTAIAPTNTPTVVPTTPCASWQCGVGTQPPTPTPTSKPTACVGWSCSNNTPVVTSTQGPTQPPGTDTESGIDVEGLVASKDLALSTVTIDVFSGGTMTLTVTSETVFKGSVSANLAQITAGHFINATFREFTSIALQIETDFPDGD